MPRDETASNDTTGRRRFLKTIGALGVTGLAGCGGDGDDTDTETATETDTDTETETPTEATTTTTADTATPTDTGTPTDTATPTDTGTPTPGQDLPDDPPPIISFSGGGSVSPGESTTLTGTIQNPYLFPIRNVEITLSPPSDDWSLSSDGETSFDELESQGTAEISWEITAPDDADGEYTISGTASFETTTDSASTDISQSVFVFAAGDVPADGLEAYFPFDGDAATNVVTGTDGEVTGEPTTDATGVVDGAWEFTTDGSRSNTVDAVTSGEDLPLNGEGATVACWINFTGHEPFGRLLQVGGDIATSTVDPPGHEIVFEDQSDALYIYAKTASTTIPVSPETWYFVVGVVDGSEARLHVFDGDGELDASPTTVDDMRSPSGTEPLVMMSGDDSETAGRLDEVRAYSRALSEQEILELYGGSGGAG